MTTNTMNDEHDEQQQASQHQVDEYGTHQQAKQLEQYHTTKLDDNPLDAAKSKPGPGAYRGLEQALAQPTPSQLPGEDKQIAAGNDLTLDELNKQNPAAPDFDPDHNNLVQHARRELGLLRRFHEVSGSNAPYGEWLFQSLEEIVKLVASQNHSGGSFEQLMHYVVPLLKRQNLLPLTSDPAEWMDMASYGGPEHARYQSTRNSKCFSQDGGRTYYNLDETEKAFSTERDWYNKYKMHESVVVNSLAEHPLAK